MRLAPTDRDTYRTDAAARLQAPHQGCHNGARRPVKPFGKFSTAFIYRRFAERRGGAGGVAGDAVQIGFNQYIRRCEGERQETISLFGQRHVKTSYLWIAPSLVTNSLEPR